MDEPRHALFPARVELPDGSVHDPVRVATDTAGITHAWTWDHTAGLPVEIGQWPVGNLARSDGADRGRPRAFTIEDGTRISSTGSCGCGHPLKAWRPALVAPRG
jgi:hypothetical protein